MRYEHLKPKPRERKNILTNGKDVSKLSPWVRKGLIKGFKFSNGRNLGWYSVFYDFALASFDIDEAIELASKVFIEEHDFKEKEWLTTAKSAYKTVEEGR
jgi:hypothetical protein